MANINKYIKALLHPAGGHQGSHKAHQAGNQCWLRISKLGFGLSGSTVQLRPVKNHVIKLLLRRILTRKFFIIADPRQGMASQIAKFMGPTWGPPGSCRPQMGHMLAPWTLLSGISINQQFTTIACNYNLRWPSKKCLDCLLYMDTDMMGSLPPFVLAGFSPFLPIHLTYILFLTQLTVISCALC